MLTLDSLVSPRSAACVVDEYVPIRVEYRPAQVSADESLYWRATGPDRLVEVKLDAKTGALTGVDVILVPPGAIRAAASVDSQLVSGEPRVGHPVFSTDAWKARTRGSELVDPSRRRIDEDVPLEFVICDDGVVVSFGAGACCEIVRDANARFCFDEAGLFWRCAFTLEADDVALLERSLLSTTAR